MFPCGGYGPDSSSTVPQCQPLPHRYRLGTFVVIVVVGHVARPLRLSPIIIMFLVPLCTFFFFFSRFQAPAIHFLVV